MLTSLYYSLVYIGFVIREFDYCTSVVCVALYRSGWTRDAEILSVWWHREHGFTHGINWRRLFRFFNFPVCGLCWHTQFLALLVL